MKVPEQITADSNSMDSHDFAVSESEMGLNASRRSVTGQSFGQANSASKIDQQRQRS